MKKEQRIMGSGISGFLGGKRIVKFASQTIGNNLYEIIFEFVHQFKRNCCYKLLAQTIMDAHNMFKVYLKDNWKFKLSDDYNIPSILFFNKEDGQRIC
jgi:hypothetical protein